MSGGRPSNIPADDREPLEVLAEEFLERHRRGENPTTAEYCRAYPKLADKIPLVFPTLLAMEDLAGAGPDDAHSTPPADDRTVAETYASRTAAASMPAALGDHRMLREIGRGGMGVVYEAIEEPLGRHVALKVLSRPVGAEGFIERFRQEARAAARLHHTNIVPIFAVGEAGGIHYYTMQLIRGQTLAAVLDGLRRERRSESREKAEATTVESAAGASYATSVARIGLQIAEALSYAHAEGILHRDIKPANVLLDVRGTAWVTDFGLAKARDSDDLTESGDVVGTLRYMAPERFWGEGDARSDVYSLGATLYELIALVPPFEAKDRARLMRDVAAADVQPLKALNPRVPRDLETIILKAIARHPADRYATAAQLADDLRRFLAYEPISARRLYAWERVWRWRQRNPAAATLLLLVLALVVASAVGGVVSSLALRDERNFAFARLSDAKLEEGRVWRLSGVAGQRQRSLAALGEAIAGNPVTELRSEVISALALTDLDVVSEEATPGESVVYDARLERFAMRGSSDSIDVYDEARRGAPVARLSGGAPFSQYHCRFSPSGKYLGVRHHEATPVLAIWDIDRASVLWKSPAPVDDVALDFSPDENFVASCERVGGVVLRRLADGEVVRRMEAGVACRKLEFDRSGRRLAGMQDGSASQVILVFDVETGMPIARLHHPERAAHVAWDPEGKALAVACFDFNVYVWSTSSWERLHVLRGHQGEVFRVAFDPRGDVLASAGWDEHTRLWDARSGEFLVVAQGRFTSFSSDGLRLGFVLGESRRGVWSVERSKEFRSLSVPFSNLRAKEPKDLRFSDNGRWLAATAGARGVRLWSIDALERPIDLDVRDAQGVGFHPDGSLLTTTGSGSLERWPIREDPSTGRITVGPPEAMGIEGSRFDLDAAGKRLAIIRGGTIRVHDLEDRAKTPIEVAHENVHRLDLSPDGRWVATATWQGEDVIVWNADDGALTARFPARSANTAFSPDGRLLAVGTGAEVILYTAGTWTPFRRWQRDKAANSPSIVCFSARGNIFAAALSRADVQLWDTRSWQEVARLESPHDAGVAWTDVGPLDGFLAMASPSNHSVKLWDLSALRSSLARLGLNWESAPPSPARGASLSQDFGTSIPAAQASGGKLGRDKLLELAECCTRMLEVDPRPETYLQRASILTELGALGEAIADIDEALRLAPDDRAAKERKAALEARRLPGTAARP
ncbi:MAG TPA: protein kinase [Planctomycetota bacterium]|nr:protein kinase [Planctomycetota bacterium]